MKFVVKNKMYNNLHSKSLFLKNFNLIFNYFFDKVLRLKNNMNVKCKFKP